MPIASIKVGERRREDMGDIAGLAASIKAHGLLHPVVVDATGALVAGERRLRAVQSLGEKWIDVTQLDELSEAHLREIELEENLRRKDLTEAERSRTLVARVDLAREIAGACAESAQAGRKDIAGQRDPGSYRDVAQRTGIPQATIRAAEKHVAAIERYPELEPLPQSTAITAAKTLDAVPAESRDEVRARIREEQATGERMLSVVAELVPGARERMEAASMRTSFTRGMEQAGNLTLLKPIAIAAALSRDDVEHAQRFIARTRRWLDELESELGSGIRLVASEGD